MQLSSTLVAALSASPLVAGQLIRPSLQRSRFLEPEDLGLGFARDLQVQDDVMPPFQPREQQQKQKQKPLGQPSSAYATPGRFTVREQTADVCDAGSRQWTGWIDVSPEKSLFFCMCMFLVKRYR